MSLLLLIDGYNIAQPIAPGRNPDPRWLELSRRRLLDELATHLGDAVRERTCVVFDAANPPRDRPSRYRHDGIDVRFAVDHLSADELIEELIREHHSPKRLMVVSSDHRIQVAARRRGAKHFDSEPWMDALTDGVVRLAVRRAPGPRGRVVKGRAFDDLGPPADDRGQDGGGAGQGDGGAGRDDGGAGQGGRSQPTSRGDKGAQKPRIEAEEEVAEWMRRFGFDQE